MMNFLIILQQSSMIRIIHIIRLHPMLTIPHLKKRLKIMQTITSNNPVRSTQSRRVNTRCHLPLPKRIPPPPPRFKQDDPPFLPPSCHSDFYPFDSLFDEKTFLAHNNDNTKKIGFVSTLISLIAYAMTSKKSKSFMVN